MNLIRTEADILNANTFEQYYNTKVLPKLEQDNMLKEKYQSRFWVFFWAVCFIVCINTLWALFSAAWHHTDLKYEQLILVNVLALLLLFWPIYRYKKLVKEDVFDLFLKFYGNWHHQHNSEVELVHSPVIPQHDAVGATHAIRGEIDGVKVEMRDTYYQNNSFLSFNWKHNVSTGVIVFLTLPFNYKATTLLFDKGGFLRRSTFGNLHYLTEKLDIPAARYFHVFGDNVEECERVLHATFFERILDLKDTFAARHLYTEIKDNYIRMYFEGSHLYFDNYKFWSKKVDKNKFVRLHNEFEQIGVLIQTILTLANNK